MVSKCPKCHSKTLEEINAPLARFICTNQRCQQRISTFDYIEYALKSYREKIDLEDVFQECYAGVNKK